MTVVDRLVLVFERIGSLADSLRQRLRYVIGLALVSGVYIAIQFYSSDSVWWWNLVKCGIAVLPVLVWLLVWSVLNQLGQAPHTVKELMTGNDGFLPHLSSLNMDEVGNVRGAYRTLKTLREQDELEELMGTISGVGMLINPLFIVLALVSFFCLFGLIVAAFIMVLF